MHTARPALRGRDMDNGKRQAFNDSKPTYATEGDRKKSRPHSPLFFFPEDWRWGSLWRRRQKDLELPLTPSAWPIAEPPNWVAIVNQAQIAGELEQLRLSVQRRRPFGGEAWANRAAKRFGLEGTLRPRGQPRVEPVEDRNEGS